MRIIVIIFVVFFQPCFGWGQNCNLKVFDDYLKVDTIPADSFIVKRIKIQNTGRETIVFSRIDVSDGTSIVVKPLKKLAPDKLGEILITMCCRNKYPNILFRKQLIIDIEGCERISLRYQFYNLIYPVVPRTEHDTNQIKILAAVNKNYVSFFPDSTVHLFYLYRSYGDDSIKEVTYLNLKKPIYSKTTKTFYTKGKIECIETRTVEFKPRRKMKRTYKPIYNIARKTRTKYTTYRNGNWITEVSKWKRTSKVPKLRPKLHNKKF